MRRLAIKTSFAVMVVLLYLLLEIAARQFIVHGLDISADDYLTFYNNDSNLRLLTWADAYRSHPYFGYIDPQALRDLERIHARDDNSTYAIAILGGSVAAAFGRYVSSKPQVFEPLRQTIDAVGDRPIQVLNLACGGYKQPQQYFVASYFLENIDMMINIEGFNEIDAPDFAPLYPTDFPNFCLRFYPRDRAASIYGWLVGVGKFTYRGLNALPRRVPFLSDSSLYFLVWWNARSLLYSTIGGVEDRYMSSVGISDPRVHEQSWKIIKERKIAIWQKYTRLQEQIAQENGVRAYFFLQPNQYLKNSKPLSNEELTATINPSIAEGRHAIMELARGAVKQMQEEGLPVYDLTGIYRSTKERVYKDACCHVNDLGNQIMFQHILATIWGASVSER